MSVSFYWLVTVVVIRFLLYSYVWPTDCCDTTAISSDISCFASLNRISSFHILVVRLIFSVAVTVHVITMSHSLL